MKRYIYRALCAVFGMAFLLSSCAVQEERVYYVQEEQLWVATAERMEPVGDAAVQVRRIGQHGAAVWLLSADGAAVYRYDGSGELVPLFHAPADSALRAVPHSAGEMLSSEHGVFLKMGAEDEVYCLTPDGHTLTSLGVPADFRFGADVNGDCFSCLYAGEKTDWHIWLWQVALSTGAITQLDLDVALPEMHRGAYWVDGGTIWTDGGHTDPETACIQQWDPHSGTLLAELPRYQDGRNILHVTVHDGRVFFIDQFTLWMRSADGQLHELCALPDGSDFYVDYHNFPPKLWFGETALVVQYDAGDGAQAQYIPYPAAS